MKPMRLRLLSTGGAFALTVSVIFVSPAAALAKDGRDGYTCRGGTLDAPAVIPGGTYSSVVVQGVCFVAAGPVTVRHDLTVTRGAELAVGFGGSNLTVRGNVSVARGGVLFLGCGIGSDSYCLDDPAQFSDPPGPQTSAAIGSIGGNLTSEGALGVIVHNTAIGGNLTQTGGGGGANCDPLAAMLGGPAYSTYESSTVGGSATITGMRSCWLGFIGNTVHRNVTISNNVMADYLVDYSTTPPTPLRDAHGNLIYDGNEVAENTIGGNLSCERNSPAAQLGDHGGPLNTVAGHATGQCRKLKA